MVRRFIFAILCSLYLFFISKNFSVRFIINALGEEDYGIYNVVAGVITMLSFVTASLQSSTQRYYSFNLGKSNYLELNKIFSASLEFYILLSVITIAIGETIGLYFINYKLAIPPERLVAANYHCRQRKSHLPIVVFACSGNRWHRPHSTRRQALRWL